MGEKYSPKRGTRNKDGDGEYYKGKGVEEYSLPTLFTSLTLRINQTDPFTKNTNIFQHTISY